MSHLCPFTLPTSPLNLGKTTTASLLADGLARMCKRHRDGADVLVVDLDPQGNQADIFGVRADVLAEQLCIGNVLLEPGSPQLLQNNIISVTIGDIEALADSEGYGKMDFYEWLVLMGLQQFERGVRPEIEDKPVVKSRIIIDR